MSSCPTCGGPLTWMAQYGQWYCYRCQRYFPPSPAPAPPPPMAAPPPPGYVTVPSAPGTTTYTQPTYPPSPYGNPPPAAGPPGTGFGKICSRCRYNAPPASTVCPSCGTPFF